MASGESGLGADDDGGDSSGAKALRASDVPEIQQGRCSYGVAVCGDYRGDPPFGAE